MPKRPSITPEDRLQAATRSLEKYGTLTPPAPGRPSRSLSKRAITQMLETAKRSLEAYGTLAPPLEELLPIMEKRCPHCTRVLPVDTHFGRRRVNGVVGPQSWCKDCRASKDAHPTRNGL